VRHPLPVLRWVALAWLAVYLPAYGAAYGMLNFLFLCNLGVLAVLSLIVYGATHRTLGAALPRSEERAGGLDERASRA
jgi:hypothetical protein